MQERAGRSSNIEGPEAASRSEWRDRNETLKETRQWRDQKYPSNKQSGEGPKNL